MGTEPHYLRSKSCNQCRRMVPPVTRHTPRVTPSSIVMNSEPLYMVNDPVTLRVLRDDVDAVTALATLHPQFVTLFGDAAAFGVQARVSTYDDVRRVYVDVATPLPWGPTCDAAAQANYLLREATWERRADMDFMLFAHSTYTGE